MRKYIFGIFIIILSVSACASSQGMERYASLMGKTREEICRILQVKPEDMENINENVIRLPIKERDMGYDFDVYLYFYGEPEALWCFRYSLIFSGEGHVKEGARVMEDLLGQLKQRYGEVSTDPSYRDSSYMGKENPEHFLSYSSNVLRESWDIEKIETIYQLWARILNTDQDQLLIDLYYCEKGSNIPG